MTDTMTKPAARKLSAREQAEDVAARSALGGADLHLSGDWATNTYWAMPRRKVEVILERAGLDVVDGRYRVDGPGKVQRTRDDAPDVTKLFPGADEAMTELAPALIPGTEVPMMADRGADPVSVFTREDGQYVGLNAAYLAWIIGDATPVSSPFYSPAHHAGYTLTQQEAKPLGPVLVTTRTTYGAEHRHLLMSVRLG